MTPCGTVPPTNHKGHTILLHTFTQVAFSQHPVCSFTSGNVFHAAVLFVFKNALACSIARNMHPMSYQSTEKQGFE